MKVARAKIKKDGKVLLLKRADNKLWCYPGGTVEENESPLEACIREVKEETDLDVIEANQYRERESWRKKGEARIYYFNITVIGDLKLNEEHLAYKWVK